MYTLTEAQLKQFIKKNNNESPVVKRGKWVNTYFFRISKIVLVQTKERGKRGCLFNLIKVE
jgi:hypothetical protein